MNNVFGGRRGYLSEYRRGVAEGYRLEGGAAVRGFAVSKETRAYAGVTRDIAVLVSLQLARTRKSVTARWRKTLTVLGNTIEFARDSSTSGTTSAQAIGSFCMLLSNQDLRRSGVDAQRCQEA